MYTFGTSHFVLYRALLRLKCISIIEKEPLYREERFFYCVLYLECLFPKVLSYYTLW